MLWHAGGHGEAASPGVVLGIAMMYGPDRCWLRGLGLDRPGMRIRSAKRMVPGHTAKIPDVAGRSFGGFEGC